MKLPVKFCTAVPARGGDIIYIRKEYSHIGGTDVFTCCPWNKPGGQKTDSLSVSHRLAPSLCLLFSTIVKKSIFLVLTFWCTVAEESKVLSCPIPSHPVPSHPIPRPRSSCILVMNEASCAVISKSICKACYSSRKLGNDTTYISQLSILSLLLNCVIFKGKSHAEVSI